MLVASSNTVSAFRRIVLCVVMVRLQIVVLGGCDIPVRATPYRFSHNDTDEASDKSKLSNDALCAVGHLPTVEMSFPTI